MFNHFATLNKGLKTVMHIACLVGKATHVFNVQQLMACLHYDTDNGKSNMFCKG